MRKLTLLMAAAVFIAFQAVAMFATSASATVYSVDIKADVGEIVGIVTVTGTTVTDFTGTASGFGTLGSFNVDGPVTLGTTGFFGPSFVGDNQWAGAPYYVTAGDGGSGGGWLLTNGTFNFRVYDYTDAFNNYGDQLAWFVSSGFNPAIINVVEATISVVRDPLARRVAALCRWRRRDRIACAA